MRQVPLFQATGESTRVCRICKGLLGVPSLLCETPCISMIEFVGRGHCKCIAWVWCVAVTRPRLFPSSSGFLCKIAYHAPTSTPQHADPWAEGAPRDTLLYCPAGAYPTSAVAYCYMLLAHPLYGCHTPGGSATAEGGSPYQLVKAVLLVSRFTPSVFVFQSLPLISDRDFVDCADASTAPQERALSLW
jgi:hypothetical protein